MKAFAEEWGKNGDNNYFNTVNSKDAKAIAKDIQSEGFSHIRAFGATLPKGPTSATGEITFFDPYSEHILTKEYTIDYATNEIKLSPVRHSMDG